MKSNNWKAVDFKRIGNDERIGCSAFDPFNWLLLRIPDLSHSLSKKLFATSSWKNLCRCWGTVNTNSNKSSWDGNIISVKNCASSTLYKFGKLWRHHFTFIVKGVWITIGNDLEVIFKGIHLSCINIIYSPRSSDHNGHCILTSDFLELPLPKCHSFKSMVFCDVHMMI